MLDQRRGRYELCTGRTILSPFGFQLGATLSVPELPEQLFNGHFPTLLSAEEAAQKSSASKATMLGGFPKAMRSCFEPRPENRCAKVPLSRARIGVFRAQGKFSLPPAHTIEFDDLETFEHTKYKPLSVSLAVETGSRRILRVAVARMPAKGLIAKKARERYGNRIDERPEARERLLKAIKPIVTDKVVIKSDENPHYLAPVKHHFPKSLHLRTLGRRSLNTGQGELKRGGLDPIFSLNHTCAMLRANINRLFRKTWCTTKRADRLYSHLVLYAQYHNETLIKKSTA